MKRSNENEAMALVRAFKTVRKCSFYNLINASLSALLIVCAVQQLHSQVEVVRVMDINVGPDDAFFFSSFADSRVHNGLLYFKANDGVHGEELWISDGTTAGTTMLKDIHPASGIVAPNSFTSYNGKIFFQADDGVHGRELWVSDGTEAGTVLFKDINEGSGHSSPWRFQEWEGLLYFSANDGTHGQELWVSDGTASGTYMLKDIRPGSVSSHSAPSDFIAFDGKLYFRADDGEHGQELWVTDGTEVGTYMLKDINEGAANSHSEPNRFTILNNELIFIADDGIHGHELWKTDGTEAGTQMIKDVNPGSTGIIIGNFVIAPTPFVFNSKIYFGGIQEDFVFRLWETDGTEAGTKLFTFSDGSSLSYARDFALFNGEMYFAAGNDEYGDELWRSDGSPEGTVLVKDINPGTGFSSPGNMTPYNFKLYFTANDGSNGYEIWQTDGTEGGTLKIAPAFGTQWSPAGMVENQFREVGGRLLFPGTYEEIGKELYAVTDATVNVAQPLEASTFNLYPNPVTETLHADFEALNGRVELTVLNSLGQLVMSQSINASEAMRIDVSDLARGVYVLSLQSEAGRHTKRFVKR